MLRCASSRLAVAGRCGDDSGQLTVLILGYAAIAALLIVVGLDVSAAFIARESLSAAADDAAVAAAGSVDTSRIYADGLQCGQPLPLDAQRATVAADASVATDTDLASAFPGGPSTVTTVNGSVATVTLSGQAHLPLEGVIGLLDSSLRHGTQITVTSHAQSPTIANGGCG